MSLKRKAVDLAADAAKKPKADAAITSFFSQPKSSPPSTSTSTSTSTTLPDTKPTSFNKATWLSTLPPSTLDLLSLEITTLDETWLAALHTDLTTPSFLALKRFLQSETSTKKVFPPPEDVYAWSRHTPLPAVKAVILGQDPYHNVNQAHGLCFSVRAPTPAPPSLENIYIAIKKDYPDFVAPAKNGGDLTPWAERGVLMLNTCLTVRAHEANSHAGKGWEAFTQRVIDIVAAKRTRGVVFLAWGSPAQKRCARVGPAGRHLVLRSVHPSPLSAARGWFECGHFGVANRWLVERYGGEGGIDWSLGGKAGGEGKGGKGGKGVEGVEGVEGATAGADGAGKGKGAEDDKAVKPVDDVEAVEGAKIADLDEGEKGEGAKSAKDVKAVDDVKITDVDEKEKAKGAKGVTDAKAVEEDVATLNDDMAFDDDITVEDINAGTTKEVGV
ncbi:uracil DNA glycosylase [Friedmanniomyces endolithicus]|nr:uracil DNA glycosylase [Friedmanniomyces endolithicus]KAK0293818.1 uracil DNA glycosylase [Friedmanniomyces endolithicus]